MGGQEKFPLRKWDRKQTTNKTMELPNPGSYTAQQNGTVLIRQEESGSLMAYVPYLLLGASVHFAGIHSLCLGAKDGTAQKKSIQILKSIFPNWEQDELADIEMPAEGEAIPQFELADCYHDDSYTPEGAEAPVIKFQPKWLNPIGGGMKKQPMSEAERKAAKTKWASKFKALLATAPASPSKAAAATPAKAAPAKSAAPAAAVSGPPGRKAVGGQARTATQEEVWEALVAANEDKSDDEKAQLYYDACDSVVEGSSADPSLIDSPAKWGKVAEALGV
jgi:hypothetical protein